MSYKNLQELNNHIKKGLYTIREKYYNKPINKKLKDSDNIRPGYLIVTGFDKENNIHLSNTINGTKHYLIDSALNGDLSELFMRQLAHIDGAIIIGKDYTLYRIGARLLNNIEPDQTAKALGREISDNEWETFGFAHEINTRHINALYASYLMPETIIFTMSGKTGDIRIYEKGRIIDSTIKTEINKNLDDRILDLA